MSFNSAGADERFLVTPNTQRRAEAPRKTLSNWRKLAQVSRTAATRRLRDSFCFHRRDFRAIPDNARLISTRVLGSGSRATAVAVTLSMYPSGVWPNTLVN